MSELLSDNEVINRVFEHIDNETTDLGDGMWREPVRNYTCPDRFNAAATDSVLPICIPAGSWIICSSNGRTHSTRRR